MMIMKKNQKEQLFGIKVIINWSSLFFFSSFEQTFFFLKIKKIFFLKKIESKNDRNDKNDYPLRLLLPQTTAKAVIGSTGQFIHKTEERCGVSILIEPYDENSKLFSIRGTVLSCIDAQKQISLKISEVSIVIHFCFKKFPSIFFLFIKLLNRNEHNLA